MPNEIIAEGKRHQKQTAISASFLHQLAVEIRKNTVVESASKSGVQVEEGVAVEE
jgi:hypothetical protein